MAKRALTDDNSENNSDEYINKYISKNINKNITSRSKIKIFSKKNKFDLIFILLIAIFSSIIVYFLINVNTQLGIYCSDVFVYLTNSLNFAGYPIGKTSNLYLSPVICFLTSLIFRIGYIDQIAIFLVTGLFSIIGPIGLYLLFRTHAGKIISLFGTILFCSFSLNILWGANGTLDIPAIAISIWIMYFTILAVDKNPKYFVVALPLFVIGFFTRSTVGFILPLIVLYILFNSNLIKNPKKKITILKQAISSKKTFLKSIFGLTKKDSFKYLIVGIIFGLILLVIILELLISMKSDLTFISQTQDVIAGGKGMVIDPGFKLDPFFYLKNLPNFISSQQLNFNGPIPILVKPSILAYLVLGLISLGAIFYTTKLVIKNIITKSTRSKEFRKMEKYRESEELKEPKELNEFKEFKNSKSFGKFKKSTESQNLIIKLIGITLISLILILTYKEISSLISEVLFLLDILLIFNILNKYSMKNLDFNLLMFSWFMIYLIFFSFSNIKVDRYLITAMPAIAYFASYSLDYLIKEGNKINFVKNRLFINLNKNNNNNNNYFEKNKEKNNINHANTGNTENNSPKNEIVHFSLLSIIPIILIIIFAMSAFANIGTMPTENSEIKNPATVSELLMNYDPNYNSKVIWVYKSRPYMWYLKTTVIGAYERDLYKLEKNNVTYYISNKNYNLSNYTIIKRYNVTVIYKRL